MELWPMWPLRLLCGTKADQPVLCLHLLWLDHPHHQRFILTSRLIFPPLQESLHYKPSTRQLLIKKQLGKSKWSNFMNFTMETSFIKQTTRLLLPTTDHGALAVYVLNCVSTKQRNTLDHVIKSKNILCYGLWSWNHVMDFIWMKNIDTLWFLFSFGRARREAPSDNSDIFGYWKTVRQLFQYGLLETPLGCKYSTNTGKYPNIPVGVHCAHQHPSFCVNLVYIIFGL